MDILLVPFLNLILLFYHLLGDNLGWAIVAITVLINLFLFPLNKKSLETARKQQALKPKLDALKERYRGDKAKLFEEQSKLLKAEGINPAAGCLPAIVQLGVIVVLIRAFSGVLRSDLDVVGRLNQVAYTPSLGIPSGQVFNTHFFAYDLTKRDVLGNFLGVDVPGFLVILAAVIQFLAARMMLPTVAKEQEVAKTTQTPADDFAADFQKQMVYLFPLIYLWFGTRYPSGLALYFLLSSLFSVLRLRLSSGRVRP